MSLCKINCFGSKSNNPSIDSKFASGELVNQTWLTGATSQQNPLLRKNDVNNYLTANQVGQLFVNTTNLPNFSKFIPWDKNGKLVPIEAKDAEQDNEVITLNQLKKKNSLAYSKTDPTIYFQSTGIEIEYEGVFTFFNALKNDILNQDTTFLHGAVRVMPDSDSNAYMVGDFKYFNLPNANQVLEINLSAANWPNFPIIGTTPQEENVKAKSLKIKINQQAILVSVESGLIGDQDLEFKNYFSVSDLQISNLISSFRYYMISFFGQNYGELELEQNINSKIKNVKNNKR